MKKYLIIILTTAALTLALVFYLRFTGFNLANIFKEQPIVIDKTANVVENIHSLTEFTTVTYYKAHAIAKQKTSDIAISGIKLSLLGRPLTTQDELVLTITGKVRAGFDLSELDEQDIAIDTASITLQLPKPRILDVITNPSDFETFVESGTWSHDEVTSHKKEARAVIEKEVLKDGILELAEKTGREKITLFLQALGFRKVIIEIKK